jgi:microcystin-dependent protein
MAQPYVGEIRIFAGNFAPSGWMLCSGQTLPISENEVLFQLIGTTYGGDGQSTFNLPNLQGRIPVHIGPNFILGEIAGTEDVTLTTNQIPGHSHPLLGSNDIAGSPNPEDSVIGRSGLVNMFINGPATVPMSNQAITPVGGSQPHTNMQPYLCVNFIISLFGIFPRPS